MILTKKIRLLPTKEQEFLFKKSCGIARFTYNKMIHDNNILFKENKPFKNEREFRKEMTILKKQEDFSWLRDVSSNVIKQAAKDCQNAYNRYFTKISGKPKFKKKGNHNSFYVNYESFKKVKNGCHIEKIGTVKLSERMPNLKYSKYYSNPRIIFDGKYWYITFGIEVKEKEKIKDGRSLGIDLGIESFATTSDNIKFKSINKTKTVRKLNKKIKRYQRKLSKSKRLGKNRDKLKRKLSLMYRRLKNIRLNYIHQITTHLVKTKPRRIVLEYLRVANMLKNRKLSKSIHEANFYNFRVILEYKCKLYGVEFFLADEFFPSSKLCSNCNNKKEDLTLKDRIYKCNFCGLEIDRDYNASLNLSNL